MKCKTCAADNKKHNMPFDIWDEATVVMNAGATEPMGWALCDGCTPVGMVAWGRPYTIEQFKEKFPDAYIMEGLE